VLSASSEQAPGEAKEAVIDGDPDTLWHTRWSPPAPSHPHWIVIDMGETLALRGFSYTPRRGPIFNGTIERYAFYVSADGDRWDEAARGAFDNIRNNPMQQFVRFSAPLRARYLKLEALSEINGQPWASAAEIGVITHQDSE
jgi:hypothetical protein